MAVVGRVLEFRFMLERINLGWEGGEGGERGGGLKGKRAREHLLFVFLNSSAFILCLLTFLFGFLHSSKACSTVLPFPPPPCTLPTLMVLFGFSDVPSSLIWKPISEEEKGPDKPDDDW